MTASTKQRQDAILSQAYEIGHVTVRDLAEDLGVSEATIRRDLHALSEQGRLELAHGGAFVTRRSDYSFRSKAMRNVEAKRTIGRLAAEFVSDGEQMFLDSGTTAYEIARRLRGKRGLSVIVNSVRVAEELDAPGLEVIMLGGQYRPDRMDTVGPMALDTLDQLRGYVALIGADGLSMEFGLTASDMDSAHLFRLAVRNARESVLVADESKFAAPSLYRIVDWDAITRVITNRRPEDAWCEFLHGRGIELICPSDEPGVEREP